MSPGERRLRTVFADAARTPVDRVAARGLVAALLDPYSTTIIAEGLADAASQPWTDRLARHLAFGMVDELLDLRDDQARTALSRRMFRRLDATDVALDEMGYSAAFHRTVERTYNPLYQGYLAADEILRADDLPIGALTAFAERFLLSTCENQDLLMPLIQARLALSAHPRRQLFAARLRSAAHSASDSVRSELDTCAPPLIVADLLKPIPFRQDLICREDFQRVLRNLDAVLDELLHGRPTSTVPRVPSAK